jgi:hypothetical protein
MQDDETMVNLIYRSAYGITVSRIRELSPKLDAVATKGASRTIESLLDAMGRKDRR